MSNRAWMTVSSTCYQGLDDQEIVARYSGEVDMVVIDLGSGSMYIPVSMGPALLRDLTTAVEIALRTPSRAAEEVA